MYLQISLEMCEPVPYSFPVKETYSVLFMTKDAFIDRAVFFIVVNGAEIPLSIVIPQYQDRDSEPPETNLRFFEDTPFHAALASEWFGKVVLFVSDGRVPSLVLELAEETLTWDKVGSPYCEKITTHSAAGEREKTIVYTPERCGFAHVN